MSINLIVHPAIDMLTVTVKWNPQGDGSLSGFPELNPYTEKLKKKHVIGACQAHPGMCCFYDKERNRHIHLVDNLLLYWANVLRKVRRVA